MDFFQYLFCNQYAEIKGRGGDQTKAQLNTMLLSTILITLYVMIIFIIYGRWNPGFLERSFAVGKTSGRTVGRLLAAMVSLMVFFLMKAAIGSRAWYEKTVSEFEAIAPEEQKRVAKQGIRYFLLAFLPVAALLLWALLSVY